MGERRCYSGGMTENGSGILSSVIPELSQGKDPNSFISTSNFPPIHLQVLLVCTLTSQTYNQDVSATIHMLVPQDLLCDPNLSPTFSSGCFLSRPQVSLRSPSCIPTHFLPEVIAKFVLHTGSSFAIAVGLSDLMFCIYMTSPSISTGLSKFCLIQNVTDEGPKSKSEGIGELILSRCHHSRV